MAAVSMFCDTNMAAMTSCENTLLNVACEQAPHEAERKNTNRRAKCADECEKKKKLRARWAERGVSLVWESVVQGGGRGENENPKRLEFALRASRFPLSLPFERLPRRLL